MSDLDIVSTETLTDTEFEDALDEMEWEKERDLESEYLSERMRSCRISTSRLDGHELNRWLRGGTTLEDVVACGRLKKKKSTVLLNYISSARVEELRELAREIVFFYEGGTRLKSYIDRVTACIIEFEYML